MDRYDAIRPFGGMTVAWIVFASSGFVKRPEVRPVPVLITRVCRSRWQIRLLHEMWLA